MTGAGAAGVATTDMLLAAGVRDLIACDRQGALHPRPREHRPLEDRVRRAHEPGRLHAARPTRRSPAPTSSSASPAPARSRATAIASMADGAIVFAMANPTPGDRARGDRGPRPGRRDRPLGLPEPDQQRARLPGRLPRRARRSRLGDQRGDEARGGRGDRRGREAGRAEPGVRRAERLQPRRRAAVVAAAVAAAAEASGVARRHRSAQTV